LLSASLFLAATIGTGPQVTPVDAADRTSSPFPPERRSAHGLMAAAFATGGPSLAALLAPHETEIGDAWLPEPPEASMAPDPEATITTSVEPASPPGADPELRAHCSPNPFATATSVLFDLPRRARIALSVHDESGREVRRLAEGGPFAPGSHLVRWDGRDDFGREVASGTYFVRLRLER
jgi:hypothetical protein